MQAGNINIEQEQEENQREADGEYDSLPESYHDNCSSSSNGVSVAGILSDLEENDPVELEYMEMYDSLIYYYDSDRQLIDWEDRGRRAFVNATNLKVLHVSGWKEIDSSEDETAWQNCIAFYKALAANRSVSVLRLGEVVIDCGSVLLSMLPFFEHNKCLRSFEVREWEMCPRSNNLLLSALSKCNTLCSLNLEFFRGVDSASATKLIAEVVTRPSLKMFTLKLCDSCRYNMTGDNRWCAALEIALQHPASKLEELNLVDCGINDVGIAYISRALTKISASVKTLSLRKNPGITVVGWVTFANTLTDSVCSLQKMNLCYNGVTDEGLAALAAYFASKGTIKELSMTGAASITPAGWSSFFQRLSVSNISFEWLDLSENTIGDDGVVSMVNCLLDMNSLKVLYLTSDIDRSAIDRSRVIANLLRSPNSNLESLSFSINSGVCDEIAELFADALTSNKHLQSLVIHARNMRSQVTIRGQNTLARLICNTESVDSIYASNHTLHNTYLEGAWSNLFGHYLTLNKKENKFEVARQKILQYYFIDGSENIQDIFEMEQKLLPRVFAWAGLDFTGWSLLYNILRGEPSLFDDKGKASSVVGKRKIAVQMQRSKGL